MIKKSLLILSLCFMMTGCYHAQITTGLEASNEVYQQAWASSFIAGLVPPSTINAEQHCTNGVARVETRHSFLNLVAQMITFSLYSPMEITVTCASASADASLEGQSIELAKNSSEKIVNETFSKAARLSAETEKPIYVMFK